MIVPPWDSRPLRHIPHSANRFRAAHHWQRKHLAIYAGNMGRAHSFEEILAAAVVLSDAGRSNWQIVFVCGGAKRAALENAARGLHNVTVLDYVEPDLTDDLLWAADVHLISMAPGWDGIVVPSKLSACLRTEAPVLFIGPAESDTAREIAKAQAGESLPNGTTGANVIAALDRLVTTKRVPLADISDEAVARVVDAVLSPSPR